MARLSSFKLFVVDFEGTRYGPLAWLAYVCMHRQRCTVAFVGKESRGKAKILQRPKTRLLTLQENEKRYAASPVG